MGLMVDIAGRPEEGWYATAHNVPSDDDADNPRINVGLTCKGSSGTDADIVQLRNGTCVHLMMLLYNREEI